jgi:alkanesulfonate monooxygenase SsuD/methylene tetrahydromethanopterin reductase-like flavin-dependent oxidoreductase (luciferase family)
VLWALHPRPTARQPFGSATGGAPALRFNGRYYQFHGIRSRPVPTHQISIWLGADKPRALALTGRVGDGWISVAMNYKTPAAAAWRRSLIDGAARDAGRYPRRIRRLYNVPGVHLGPACARA